MNRVLATEALVHLPLAPDARDALEPAAQSILAELSPDCQIALSGQPVAVAAYETQLPAGLRSLPAANPKLATRLEERLKQRFLQAGHLNAQPHELLHLRALSPGRAGNLLVAGMHELASAAPDAPELRIGVGDALLELAAVLPMPLDVPLYDLLEDRLLAGRLPRPALSWALSRAGPQAIAAGLGARIRDASPEVRMRLLPWTRDMAANLHAAPPFAHVRAEWRESAAAKHAPQKMMVRRTARSDAQPPEPGLLYPWIVASNEQPIVGDRISIEVSLSGREQEGTSGEVRLPEGAHKVRVHLLFGDTSQWGDCMVGEDSTSTPARFEVVVPPITGANAELPIRVNFYLNARWCGEGARSLCVRSSAKEAPGSGSSAPVPMFRRQFSFDPGAEPPDLVVRIQSTSSPGRFIWSCVSPHMPLPPPAAPGDAEMTLHSDAENFVRSLFEPLVGKVLKKLHISEIRGIGEAIYRSTPKVFKDAYWALHRGAADRKFRFESVLIVTDEPCIPWELMRILDDSSPPVPAEFLGIRHSVGRWLSSKSQAPLQRIPITAAAVAASDYQHVDAVEGKLPWVKEEKALLRDRYSAKPIELRSEPLIDFLMQGGVEMFHLACHGQMSVVSPLTSELIMEDTPENLRPTMVDTEEVRGKGLGKRKPLVFLNACEAGGAARSLSLVAGFPAAFLGGGAAAVVSPLWSINDERAKEIAECFYEAALGSPSKTVGEVMKQIRSRWVDRELTFLAYVLYGDPLLRLELRR